MKGKCTLWNSNSTYHKIHKFQGATVLLKFQIFIKFHIILLITCLVKFLKFQPFRLCFWFNMIQLRCLLGFFILSQSFSHTPTFPFLSFVLHQVPDGCAIRIPWHSIAIIVANNQNITQLILLHIIPSTQHVSLTCLYCGQVCSIKMIIWLMMLCLHEKKIDS